VTGAAQGIGKAIGTAFVDEGARLVIGDINGDLAAKTAAELAKGGREVRSIRIDVAEATGGQQLVDFCLKEFGRVDILVNNAGFGLYDEFCQIPWERSAAWRALLIPV